MSTVEFGQVKRTPTPGGCRVPRRQGKLDCPASLSSRGLKCNPQKSGPCPFSAGANTPPERSANTPCLDRTWQFNDRQYYRGLLVAADGAREWLDDVDSSARSTPSRILEGSYSKDTVPGQNAGKRRCTVDVSWRKKTLVRNFWWDFVVSSNLCLESETVENTTVNFAHDFSSLNLIILPCEHVQNYLAYCILKFLNQSSQILCFSCELTLK